MVFYPGFFYLLCVFSRELHYFLSVGFSFFLSTETLASEERYVKHQSTLKNTAPLWLLFFKPRHFIYAFDILLVHKDQPLSQRHAVNIRSLNGLLLPGRGLNSPKHAPSVVVSLYCTCLLPHEEEEGWRRGLVKDAWLGPRLTGELVGGWVVIFI